MWEGLLLVLRTRALMTLYGVRMLMGIAAQVVAPMFSLFVQSIAAPDAKVASLAGTRTPVQLGLLRALAGVSAGGILAAVNVLQASLAPGGRYGAVYGVNTSMMAAANAVSPMMGAALVTNWGLPSVFLGAAVMYGLGTVVTALVVPGGGIEAEGEE